MFYNRQQMNAYTINTALFLKNAKSKRIISNTHAVKVYILNKLKNKIKTVKLFTNNPTQL